MPKLSDTQSILLSHAAQQRELSLYPLPDSHARSGARITKAIGQLLNGCCQSNANSSLDDAPRSLQLAA